MIELKLIPDGLGRVPPEATDDEILAGLLEAASNIPDDSTAPIAGWRDVERVVPGTGEYLALRLPGTVDDYPGGTLDSVANALVGNINGLKTHPNGWTNVEPDTFQS